MRSLRSLRNPVVLDKAVEETVIENRPLLRATRDHGGLRAYRSLQSVIHITHYKYWSLAQSIMHQSRDSLAQCTILTLLQRSCNVSIQYRAVLYSTVSWARPGESQWQAATTNRRNRFRLRSREQREAHRQRHLVVRVSSRYQKITDRSLTIHI